MLFDWFYEEWHRKQWKNFELKVFRGKWQENGNEHRKVVGEKLEDTGILSTEIYVKI